MHRIQVQLTAAQERQLKDLAKLRGCSISALIRESVDRLLGPAAQAEDEKWARASAAIGSLRDTATDVAVNHDKYIAEAIYAKKVKRR